MMTVITRCPSCGTNMLADNLDPAFVALFGEAMVDTSNAAGFLPERIEDFATYLANWCALIRSHHPRLRELSDREIAVMLRSFGEETQQWPENK